MLPEPIAVTLQVVDALEQVGAAYVIGGSLASTILLERILGEMGLV